MLVRTFDWRDLPSLHRNRYKSVYMDSALVSTRGPQLFPGALLSYLASSVGVFTCVADGNETGEELVIGQFIHLLDSHFGHLTFMTPEAALSSPGVPALLDYMASLLGERGAMHLLADVDERSQAFEPLRKSGFAIYGRQRIWKLVDSLSRHEEANPWRAAVSQDTIAIRSLYNNLVPALVQQAEPFLLDRPRGLVYYQEGDLLAFVELRYGHRGIWAQPFVHPDAGDFSERFVDFLHKVPRRYYRPVYICVRSYQSWLEASIEELGGEAGPRQAVMVKHLAVQQKALRPVAIPALEGGQPEVTASIVRSENK